MRDQDVTDSEARAKLSWDAANQRHRDAVAERKKCESNNLQVHNAIE